MKSGLPAACLLTLVLYSGTVSAQSRQEDSIFYQSALTHTLSVYHDQLGDQSQIYNGILYPVFDLPLYKGSPYFLTEKSGRGSIVYDSIFYPNLSLLYDDYRQFLVVIIQSFQLKLINERVSSFTIADHHFVHVFADSTYRGLPGAGFYEVLYPGRSLVLKHTFKKIREIISLSDGLTRYMDETNDYYVRIGNSFKPVNTKRELLTVMKDHRKEIQRYMRKNNLNYRTDRGNDLVLVATYYDQHVNP